MSDTPNPNRVGLDKLAEDIAAAKALSKSTYYLDVTAGDGKYRVIANADMTEFRALRYGGEWRDLTGDNLVLALAMEVSELRTALANLLANPDPREPWIEAADLLKRGTLDEHSH